MEIKFEVLQRYLKAALSGRETVEETQKFMRALAANALKHGASRVLICVSMSKPIFRVQEYQIALYLKELAARPDFRVALVADETEVQSAHDYVELLAKQHGASLRAFRDEAAAIAWLEEPKPG